MTEEDDILEALKRGLAMRRGYADSRSWPMDRELEQRGVAEDFIAAAGSEPGAPFSNLKARPRGEDPPDCELTSSAGKRVAIEITELVDRKAVETVNERIKRQPGSPAPGGWVEWNSAKLVSALESRLAAKDCRERLKDGPYDEYIVVIYTAEPALDSETTRRLINDYRFNERTGIDRAYLSLDHVPGQGYPLIRLPFTAGA